VSQQYRTREGDMLDEIRLKYYRTAVGTVEQVLAVNRELAEYAAVLPSAVVIELPEIQIQTADVEVRLWS